MIKQDDDGICPACGKMQGTMPPRQIFLRQFKCMKCNAEMPISDKIFADYMCELLVRIENVEAIAIDLNLDHVNRRSA